jgi:hypothetical protein
MRKLGVLAVAAALSLTAVIGASAGSAHQVAKRGASSGCTNGNVCVWKQPDYTGCWKDMNNDQSNYSTLGWDSGGCSGSPNNEVSSLKNRGTCRVRMQDYVGAAGATGPHITFSAWNSGDPNGGTVNDPHLSSGGGESGSTTENWEDRISSHDFCP